MGRLFRYAALIGLFQFFGFGTGWAQCKSDDGGVTASPSQPVATDSPETIAPGVLEVEMGWGRAWPGGGQRRNSFGTMYKFGAFCNFEFRNYLSAWQSQSVPGQPSVSGNGDDWMTVQYRFLRETKSLPSVASHYMLKIPMASVGDGAGSGEKDHMVAISAGKTVRHTSFNFEAKWILLGQPKGAGFERYEEYSANFTRSLTKHVTITGEAYGDTQSSATTAGFGSSLWYVGYSVNPRLVFDAGIDAGFTHGAPNKRIFAGVTYAVGDLYRAMRPHRVP